MYLLTKYRNPPGCGTTLKGCWLRYHKARSGSNWDTSAIDQLDPTCPCQVIGSQVQ